MPQLVWFRADLRVADNTALAEACRAANDANEGVAGVFLIAADQWREHDWAPIKVDFILRNLRCLSESLSEINIPLLIRPCDRFDDAPRALLKLASELGCDAIHFNREYEVNEKLRDDAVVEAFDAEGMRAYRYTDQVILPPGDVLTKDDRFYTVYSPFRRRWEATFASREMTVKQSPPKQAPLKRSKSTIKPDTTPDAVDGFAGVSSVIDGEAAPFGDDELWPAGEDAAKARLSAFARDCMDDYRGKRDLPATNGTSALSPYLAVGVLSPRQCLRSALQANDGKLTGGREGVTTWIGELIWREFYKHLLVGFPKLSKSKAFKGETERVPWRTGAQADKDFDAWCNGQTGYPIVDAAMRQLKAIGWMHNRLRMIVAMFLTKDLLIDWRRGEKHFMEHLIDGDLAANNGGWQWSASTGTDAQPYFRIFNPITQSEKFDSDGAFIRRHVPELAEVEGKAIHWPHGKSGKPGQGGLFGGGYVEPIVDHKSAREKAIAVFKAL